MKAELVRAAGPTEIAITEALAQTTHLQKIDDKEVLEAVGGVLNEALSEEPAADERGTFEVGGAVDIRDEKLDRKQGQGGYHGN